MEIKDFNKAIDILNQIIANQDNAFLEHAEWYLALCYIKTNRLTEAKKIINQIKTSDSYYRALASDVSIKLN
jgi:tetratricopeptide (TPR) repeat protein